MMKPIEPGCLCLLIHMQAHPQHNGKQVTVVRLLSLDEDGVTEPVNGVQYQMGPIMRQHNVWHVRSTEPLDLQDRSGAITYRLYDLPVPESKLMRIDGDDEQETEEVKQTSQSDV